MIVGEVVLDVESIVNPASLKHVIKKVEAEIRIGGRRSIVETFGAAKLLGGFGNCISLVWAFKGRASGGIHDRIGEGDYEAGCRRGGAVHCCFFYFREDLGHGTLSRGVQVAVESHWSAHFSQSNHFRSAYSAWNPIGTDWVSVNPLE